MKLSITTLVIILMQITVSCGNSKETESVEEMGYDILEQGVLDGAGEEGFKQECFKINNVKEMKDVITRMNSYAEEINKIEMPGDEDLFEQYILIFLFDKVRESRGYDLKINKLYSTSEKIHLNASVEKIEDDAANKKSQYYKIIKVEKSDKPLMVKFTDS